jgi:hypothetical protein
LRAKQVARHDQLIKVSALCANPVAIGWMSARTDLSLQETQSIDDGWRAVRIVLSPFRGIISEAIGAMLNVCVYYMPTKPEWRQPILLSQATAWPLRFAHCTSSVVFP